MKSFGLDGKVGAPAIVRENPLLRKYDQKFAPGCDHRPFEDDTRIVRSLLPFSWLDVLGVVQERYTVSANDCLSAFLRSASRTVPDRSLVYDLDTPSLTVRFDPSGECGVRSVVFRGSCDELSATESTRSLIDGHVRIARAYGGMLIVRRAVRALNVLSGASVLYAPIDELDAGNIPYASMSKGGLLLSTAPIDYFADAYGAIFDHRVSPIARDLLDLAVNMPDDPAALRDALGRANRSFRKLRSRKTVKLAMRHMRQSSIRSDLGDAYLRFTPRGASR